MKLLKKNVHMNKVINIASTQLTLDDDFIVPDIKPDVEKIIAKDGDVRIEAISYNDGKLNVRGTLEFRVLYGAADADGLGSMKGGIVFDERINCDDSIDGMIISESGLNVECIIENMLIGIINTRKISVKAIVKMNVTKDELYDIDTATDVENSKVSMLKKKEKISQVACLKNDIFRIKEDMEIGSKLPNIGEILWKYGKVNDVIFRPIKNGVAVSGELKIFVIYKPAEDGVPCQWCENSFAFSGNVPVDGCNDDMIPDIDYKLKDLVIEVRNDYDGEPRIIGIDGVLTMNIHMYREEEIEYLADVYSLEKQLNPIYRPVDYSRILMKNVAKSKISHKFNMENDGIGILQICFCEGENHIKTKETTKEGIMVTGYVLVNLIYLTDNDIYPFGGATGKIPYEYTIEIPGIKESTENKILACPVSLSASMSGESEVEVRGNLIFECLAFDRTLGNIIEDIVEEEPDKKKIMAMPSIVGHMVKEGESLWDIGKRYYVSVAALMQMNELTGDEVKVGDKILVVKG